MGSLGWKRNYGLVITVPCVNDMNQVIFILLSFVCGYGTVLEFASLGMGQGFHLDIGMILYWQIVAM